jgi:hypothetical protein
MNSPIIAPALLKEPVNPWELVKVAPEATASTIRPLPPSSKAIEHGGVPEAGRVTVIFVVLVYKTVPPQSLVFAVETSRVSVALD